MKVVDNYTSFGGRLYNLFKEKNCNFDLKKRNANHNIVMAMLKKGLIQETEIGTWTKQISSDVKYDFPYPNIYTSKLKTYCDFLGCSADYLLGLTDHKKVQNKAGLSDKAINRLAANKEFSFVTNALLERKGIEYLVEAIEFDYYHEAQHKRIADYLYKTDNDGPVLEKKQNLPGITLTDLGIYHSNVKAGYQGQRENIAIVYLDQIEKDKIIKKHFKEKAEEKYNKQVEEEAAKK